MKNIRFLLEPKDLWIISTALGLADNGTKQSKQLARIFEILQLQGRPASISVVGASIFDELDRQEQEAESLDDIMKSFDDNWPDKNDKQPDINTTVEDMEDWYKAEFVEPKPEPDVIPEGWDSRVPRPKFDPVYAAAMGKGSESQTFKPKPEVLVVTPKQTPASMGVPKPEAPVKKAEVVAKNRNVKAQREEPNFDTSDVCTRCGGFWKSNPHSDPKMNCNCVQDDDNRADECGNWYTDDEVAHMKKMEEKKKVQQAPQPTPTGQGWTTGGWRVN